MIDFVCPSLILHEKPFLPNNFSCFISTQGGVCVHARMCVWVKVPKPKSVITISMLYHISAQFLSHSLFNKEDFEI
jgi:hypothetical protein